MQRRKSNIPELKLLSKEEWAKIPPSQYAGLINCKGLSEVTAAKERHTCL